MHHIMQMVRREYHQYSAHKLAVISPCIAKKREFEAIGLGDYNVTMQSLESYFRDHHVDLSKFPEAEFEGPPAERAVLFSSPGGLKETLERWNPGASRATRKIEGPRTVFPYLDELSKSVDEGIAPLLVDCLCCEKGCNGGTGTPGRKMGLDQLEHLVSERAKEARASSPRRAKGMRPLRPPSRSCCASAMIRLDSAEPMLIGRPPRNSANPVRRSCKRFTRR